MEYDIMQSIIGAVIGAAVCIIAVLLSELFLGKRIYDIIKSHDSSSVGKHNELSKEHSSLSKEHNRLSHEHGDLSKEHGSILSELKNYILEKTTSTNNILIEERTKHEFIYNNLNDHQRTISDSIKNLEGFASEFERVISQNKRLSNEVTILRNENEQLEARIQLLYDKLNENEIGDELER